VDDKASGHIILPCVYELGAYVTSNALNFVTII